MMEDEDYIAVIPDFKKQTLEWAAATDPSSPSPRLEFLKDFIGLLSVDELKKLRKMASNTKRKASKLEKRTKMAKTEDVSQPTESGASLEAEAASSSTDAANSSSLPIISQPAVNVPWWENYDDDDFLSFDTEQVSKFVGNGTEIQAATVDVVDYNMQKIYSSNVFHETGSFEVNYVTKQITGFEKNHFDKKEYPEIETVKNEMDNLLQGKYVVTHGGASDYKATKLTQADYKFFDLQMHWHRSTVNEHGVEVKEAHSLASLAKYYLKKDIHQSSHSSLEDAQITMELFHVYKKIKLQDDPENLSSMYNYTHSYNEIPVIQKRKFKRKKKPNHSKNYPLYFPE